MRRVSRASVSAFLTAAIALALAACGDNLAPLPATGDGGPDAPLPADAAPDTGPPADAGPDAAPDAAPDAGPAIASIEITVPPGTICPDFCYQIRVDDTLDLVATAYDADGNELDVAVSWDSASDAIATVTDQGARMAQVLGVAVGEVEITATAGGVTGHRTVSVQPRPVARIVVEPEHLDLAAPGATGTFTATAYDDRDRVVPGVAFQWTTGNAAVVTVADGTATAVGNGAAAISVGTELGGFGWATVTVATVIPTQPARSVAQVNAGFNHSCALETDSTASCWGWNYWGQLGREQPGEPDVIFPTPAPVIGDHHFRQLDGDSSHVCALEASGAAWCWGYNGSGELGAEDPDLPGSVEPVAVTGGLLWRQIATGENHTCAVTLAGQGYCWGFNDEGQLGTGAFADRPAPTVVAGALPWREIKGGLESSCGVTVTGHAYCWGSDAFGQLGNGVDDGDGTATPSAVIGDHRFAQIDHESSHACAVTVDRGEIWCWGRNEAGQLGNGTVTRGSGTPVKVVSTERFTKVTVGIWHSCGLTTGGDVWCWGMGELGQLGRVSLADSTTPVQVAGGLRFSDVEAGGYQTCGRTTDGHGYCWGSNLSGELGNGTGGDGQLSPTPWPILAP